MKLQSKKNNQSGSDCHITRLIDDTLQYARSTQTNHSRDLFKDEVHELGVALGFPSAWPIATSSPA